MDEVYCNLLWAYFFFLMGRGKCIISVIPLLYPSALLFLRELMVDDAPPITSDNS